VTGPEIPVLTHREFRKRIYRFYRYYPRDLTWRDTSDPYLILISGIMLQQTAGVTGAGDVCLVFTKFPDFASLHTAPVEELLRA